MQQGRKLPKKGEPGYETFRLTGRRYGDLEVIRRDDYASRIVDVWRCVCRACGNERGVSVPEHKLVSGEVTCCASCRALLRFRETGGG